MMKTTDTTPKPRTLIERIGGKDWYLEERELDVIDEVTLWSGNPRLLPYLAGCASGANSEEDLEAALQNTGGYDTLRRSIQLIGQMTAIYVWRKEEDHAYLVFEGATRVAILRELARARANGPEASRFRKVKAYVLPPDFGEVERVILLARIHVRGSGVRSWGRYIEAKFIHDNVTSQNGRAELMSVSDMARHMEKSISWVQRLRDAYEFGRHFVEHLDSEDAYKAAVREFSVLEEISKAAVIGPRLRDYKNTEHDALRGEVFDMVKNEVFSEYRDARFMKDFYEDPEKWAQLKTGEKGIAKRLAAEVNVSSSGVKAKIAAIELQLQRTLDRNDDHGLTEDDIEALQRAQGLIHQHLHPGVRPFRMALHLVTKALSEASLADVKALKADEVTALMEAVGYFTGLVGKHNPAAVAAA
jgi:hypothetical protein